MCVDDSELPLLAPVVGCREARHHLIRREAFTGERQAVRAGTIPAPLTPVPGLPADGAADGAADGSPAQSQGTWPEPPPKVAADGDQPEPLPGAGSYDRPIPPPGVTPIGSIREPSRTVVEGRVRVVEVRSVERNSVLAA